MKPINYDEANVPGGIHAFDELFVHDAGKEELGEPMSKEAIDKYAQQVEEIQRAQHLGRLAATQEDEDLLTAA